ncbi:pyridoxamine 5'-phosphate oxidase family protein [Flammeovirgaceae bacterium SG7u.111]|nr:pyridoxamine 5'-phosphate oxidase family protein [Flammeovirgaceae bacterium SG7u.132]WPO38344.1 pyridoxamine 5'-phosphate oxidase family protein [Flammeovirgaceae bacterium SG7u.111]
MGKQLAEITPQLQEFIENQHIFFVGTAMKEGKVNISPKGMDSFKVLGPNKAIWLNVTGSGNETATHVQESNRMTIMFCAFEGKPMILRLYGTAKVYHQRDKEWDEHIGKFTPLAGARQIFELDIDLVQTSCGMAVPFMDYKEEREELNTWATKQGEDRIKEYWQKKNTTSIDGHDTGIF